MKHLHSLVLLLFLGAMTGIMSCGGDDAPAPTEEEIQLALLARPWTLTNATVDGDDVTSNFSGLVVTFTNAKGYSTNGDYAPVWPSTGTWDFGANLNTIARNDGVSIALTNVSETGATLSFNFNTLPGGGRIDGIVGDYVMTFTSN